MTLQLVQERDGMHDQPAGLVFSDAEIDTIETLTAHAGTQNRTATLTRHATWPAQAGSWPGSAAGTDMASRPDPSTCISGWNASMLFTKDARST